jgi:hypothetical protein
LSIRRDAMAAKSIKVVLFLFCPVGRWFLGLRGDSGKFDIEIIARGPRNNVQYKTPYMIVQTIRKLDIFTNRHQSIFLRARLPLNAGLVE